MKRNFLISGVVAFGVLAGGLVVPAASATDNSSTQAVSSASVVKDVSVGNAGGGLGGGSAADKPKSPPMNKATAKQQRDWTASLPYACRVTPINDIKLTNTKRSSYKIHGNVSIDSKTKKPYYKLEVDGKLAPSHAAAKALMKHECGHVLAFIYKNKKGNSAFNKLMNTGWKSTVKMRNENVADCMADNLKAVRKTKNYTVGYGTKCSANQKKVAKTIVNYGKNRKP